MDKLTYTVKEVASVLNIGICKAYNLVTTPDFPSIKIGRQIIIPKTALDKWLLETSNKKECISNERLCI